MTIAAPTLPSFSCVTQAWRSHEAELRAFLIRRLPNEAFADDILQDVFIKAMRQGAHFCELESARAWLFTVARHALADFYRTQQDHVALDESLPEEKEIAPAIDSLTNCIPYVLASLSEQDREAITLCDLQGMPQETFSELKGLSLSGAKSRIQRARKKMRARLTENCQVKFDEAGNVCCFQPQSVTLVKPIK